MEPLAASTVRMMLRRSESGRYSTTTRTFGFWAMNVSTAFLLTTS